MNKNYKRVLAAAVSALICFQSAAFGVIAEDFSDAGDEPAVVDTVSTVAINETNFPDQTFREYVLANYNDGSGNLSTTAANEKSLILSGKGITSLKGIENFPNLENLMADNNKLTSLDLTKNTSIKQLKVSGNMLTSLDVNYLTNLTNLWYGANPMTSMNITLPKGQVTCQIYSTQPADYLDHYYSIGNVGDYFYLSNIPGFDASKASNWRGAEYDSEKNALYNFSMTGEAYIVTYLYDCGNGYTLEFNLKLESYSPTETNAIAINAANFPDANFMEYVKSFDKDNSGKLSESELAAVTSMDVSNKGISSLEGVKYFTSLQTLNCSHNSISYFDDIQYMENLVNLNISYNNLSTLSAYAENSKLKYIDASYNKLTAGVTVLTGAPVETLILNNNDISSYSSLTGYYYDYSYVKKLDISNNPIKMLTLTYLTSLETLDCSNTYIAGIDLSKNTKLKTFNYTGCETPSLGTVTGSYQLSNLRSYGVTDTSKISSVTGASLNSDKTALINFTSNKVTYVYDTGNSSFKPVFTLNFDGYTSVEGYAIDETNFPDENFRNWIKEKVDSDKDGVLTSSELSKTSLSPLNLGITSLKGIELFKELTTLKCYSNDIKELDLSGNVKLKTVDCNNNKNLTSLNLKGCTALTTLNASVTALPTVDLSDCTELTTLDIHSSSLTSIDLSNNTKLTGKVYLNYNKLTSLDLSKCPSIQSLEVYNNNLVALDISCLSAVTPGLSAYNFTHDIGTVSGDSYNIAPLRKLGFDPSKVLSWSGATYDAATDSLINFTDTTNCKITYTYDCGKSKTMSVTLTYQTTGYELVNPTITSYVASNKAVTITWSPVEGATQYDAMRTNGNDNEWGHHTTQDASTTTYKHSGLNNNVEYKFCVRAFINGKWTEPADSQIITLKPLPLDYPTISAAPGDGKVTLTWNKVDRATGYYIYTFDKSNNKFYIQNNSQPVTTLTYTVTGLTNDTEYGFFIAPTDGIEMEQNINYVVYATPKTGFAITSQPANTTVIEGLDTTLSVAASGSNLTYQWQKYSGGSWVNISGATSAVLSISNAAYSANGTKYRCIVTSNGSSLTTNEAVLTVKAAEKVTESEVNSMTAPQRVKFVNAFNSRYDADGSDCVVLTAAQLKAIELVLAQDYQ